VKPHAVTTMTASRIWLTNDTITLHVDQDQARPISSHNCHTKQISVSRETHMCFTQFRQNVDTINLQPINRLRQTIRSPNHGSFANGPLDSRARLKNRPFRTRPKRQRRQCTPDPRSFSVTPSKDVPIHFSPGGPD
jgi:hypothetical protein